MSEHASAQDSAGYRRKVAAFATLGYAWVVGCFVLAGGALWWSAWSLLHGRFRTVTAWALVAAAGLLWSSFRALWVRLDPPQGLRLARTDAPALFDALDRIRAKVKGPAIHEVLLDGALNASIGQRPRWGLFGGARNHLTIGLPFLMAVDRQRFLAILAHEYGHLRGGHGRFAAWIYRTRMSWARLHEDLHGKDGVFAFVSQAFLGWYFPRFIARTFAIARQDEYEADRIAAKLVGPEATAAGLVEMVIKGDWLRQQFWPQHWALAATNTLPVGPYASMQALLAGTPPQALARNSLREALREISGVDDTHPVLRDRLEALGTAPAVPAWSRRPALELLGAESQRWVAQFDRQWVKENASAWKRHHARLALVLARSEQLARQGRKSADEWVELANLQHRLDAAAPVHEHCEQALAQSPGHRGALRALCNYLPEDRKAQRLELLAQLHEAAPDHRWWAARAAVAQLEADPAHDGQALKAWRGRVREGEAAEGRAWDELTTPPFFSSSGPHDLSELELGELKLDLAGCAAVSRAWIVTRKLREFPSRRCYVVVVDLPGMDDEDRYHLCRELESSLGLPGAVLVLWPGHSPTLAEVQRHAGPPFYHSRGSR